MRFSLRNQTKIEKALGKPYLELLLNSLKQYFLSCESIEEFYYPTLDNGKGSNVIHVPNIQKGIDSWFEFVIVSKTFNVHNLAYYSAVG